ncbi:MAG TPA: chemotaxis response regulator protein-glutamate methylesterase [Gemmatimonadaceae bacterium]|jgi:two-component system chemotaxis response regulator CheB
MSFSRAPRSVLVVDDSAFMRRLITELVHTSDEFRVVGTARDGLDAVRKVHALRPDVVTLDIEMPELDGLRALGRIMRESPCPVVMLAAATGDAGDQTIRALELGAVDFVRKPSGPVSPDLSVVRDRLLDALRASAQANLASVSREVQAVDAAALHVPLAPPSRHGPATRAVAIAASTGGPRALATLIPRLPAGFGAAVLVAQHMPSGFTRSLAERLDALGALIVSEAADGEPVHAGHVYVAPGGTHMRVTPVEGGVTIGLDRARGAGPSPSADILFRSVANCFGVRAVGVVLTGMGRDAAAGLRCMHDAGAVGFAQDEESTVIHGMPRAAVAAGGVDRVVPLADMARAISDTLEHRHG